ncbi:MAG: alanine racemase [Spirochaetales bacterium]|uniref:Alanine racemase n=1 Tax=Candidatus Thalassospirochaeta sargassi TaxID=3119039 RepID=A0AAJ1IFG7_9SPIO|nr:alanine racemase [Spirochaetales bacterium]
MRATRALIHTANLRHNLSAIKKLTGEGVKLCLAVKADAYGHGAVGISETAVNAGTDYLAVATISEAEELRENGITIPIIVLSPVLPEELETLYSLNLDSVVSTTGEIERLSSTSGTKKAAVHLKIDTGMGRIGCNPGEALELAAIITKTPGIELAGLCTHFPVSDSSAPDDIEYTKKQINIFNTAVDSIRRAGINPGIIHAANSGAILNYPESYFDMVRPGILAYGYLPGGREGLFQELPAELLPKPVMSFESKLMHIKKVEAGSSISYGRRFRTEKATWIGTIPAGYADGYTRSLTNRAGILINGKKYPVAGTVCMDQLMVDLGTELEVNLYDKVIMFGSEEGAETAADLTAVTKTIPYELLCSISKRVPRIFD